MDFERRGLHERHQSVEVADADERFGLRRILDEDDIAVEALPGVLLKERLSADPVRTAHEGQRPVHDERLHDRPSLGVIVGEAFLRDALVGPIDAIGMGQRHAALRPFGRGVCGHGRLTHNLARGLILAQALKGRLTKQAVPGPAPEIDLGDEFGPNEADLARFSRREPLGERARPDAHRIEPREQRLGDGGGKPGADASDIAQVRAVVDAEHQRADRLASGRRGNIAGDDKLLLGRTLGLDPALAATRDIDGLAGFRHDAFETKRASALQNELAVLDKVGAVANQPPPAPISWPSSSLRRMSAASRKS